MQFRFSTDDVPERDRLDMWAETMLGAVGLNALPLPDAPGPFRGHLTLRTSGPLFNLNVWADAHYITRQSGAIARRQSDGYWIYRETGAGAAITHAGREFATLTGNLMVADGDLPCEVRPTGPYAHEVWFVPKALLDPHLPTPGQPVLPLLSDRTGVDALAAGYLDTLARNWDGIPGETMGRVADTLCRLIGIACGVAAGEQPDAVRAGRLTAVKRHIELHLAVPELSPASAAAALGISVRSLHLLFEPTGTSFARHVLRRRLEECRHALLANPSRPVIDIAFAWGFSSLSSFYRTFQANFGTSPGELREAARTAHRT